VKSYDECDGLDLAALVASRQASPRELLDEALWRARAVQASLNPLSQLFPERAWAAIDRGLPDGPFRGVPFLLKDVASLAGTPSWAGSRLAARLPPSPASSVLVERYERAGLVIFGKTTTPELGIAASTETTLTGITCNPWDPSRTTGGSSGGSAAAVAARVVPVAHGSDGGGSIRIPASCCGLFGLKPTRARTPGGSGSSEGWGGLTIDHVLSRSVRDSAAILDATHGSAPGDPYCAPPVGRPFLEEVGRPPGTLRVAMQRQPFSRVGVSPECAAALDDAARLLERLGHRVEEAEPKVDWPELALAHWVLVAANMRLSVLTLNGGVEPALGEIDSVVAEAVDFARTLPGDLYPRAQRAIRVHGQRMAEFHERFDVLMSPTTAQPAVPLGMLHTNNPDLAAYRECMLRFSPFTSFANHSGQPSMSVPLFWTAAGLPVGVMVSAAFGNEALLFRLAGQLERAQPWANRRPPVAAAAPEIGTAGAALA
jgi:Asp-tRNA(Asn)/Glu-tRNA(Gln) amidotransferase A subunit family amidase